MKKDLFLIVLHIFGQSVKGPLKIKEFLFVSINHIIGVLFGYFFGNSSQLELAVFEFFWILT